MNIQQWAWLGEKVKQIENQTNFAHFSTVVRSSQPHDKKGGGCNWGSNVCGHNGLSTPGTICHSDLHWLQL